MPNSQRHLIFMLMAGFAATACGLTNPVPAPLPVGQVRRLDSSTNQRRPITPYGVEFCLGNFTKADRNHDGLLTKAELEWSYLSVPMTEDPPPGWEEETKARASKDFATWDLDHSGGLTIIELFPQYWNQQQPDVRPGMSPQKLLTATRTVLERFRALDDGNEFLTLKEYAKSQPSPAIAQSHFQHLDRNADTILSLGEFFADFPEFSR